MKALTVAIVFFAISCSGTAPLKEQPKKATVPPPDKVNITYLFTCFKYEDSPFVVADNKYGFIKIGSVINGSPREGFSTLHLFRHGNVNLVGWLEYACGQACEQTVKWYRVTRDCKVTEVSPKKFLAAETDGQTRFLSLPRKGKDIYVVESEMIDVYPEYEMRVEEKYTWKNGIFEKDESFEAITLPMSKENIEKYYHR
jgi:hypothetical protein